VGIELFDGLEMDEWRNQSLPRSRERAAEPEGYAMTTDNTVSPAFLNMAFTGRGATEPFFIGHRLAALRPNGEIYDSFMPPGFFKLSFLQALFLGGIRQSPSRPYPNYPDYLVAWDAYALATEPNNLPPLGSSMAAGLATRSAFLPASHSPPPPCLPEPAGQLQLTHAVALLRHIFRTARAQSPPPSP